MREEIIKKHADEAVVWRHWLHAHPEISTKEKESSAYIKAVLEDMGLTVQTFKENYGLTAVIEGTGEGKCLGLRADFEMDNASYLEENGQYYCYKDNNLYKVTDFGLDCLAKDVGGFGNVFLQKRKWSKIV